ncbi:transposase IS4 family protein [Candidatus Magnetobacterium bavaricum]|uniref:Transposase IS4 family protein n=1 Tax=Candidatus Magnetobacterium bavaricum TaxID=29290 RepID=A0A0F3GR26_9BACT|nr:transposase IS4 family protein [Candidatus Magnetobacterium bavaricum]
MDIKMLDLYSDYIISSFAQTTATNLSNLLGGKISHDKVTRFLSSSDYTSANLWQLVKPTVRSIEDNYGFLIFDDTIEEKPYTDENEIITWHFDHCQGRTVKGVNILNCLYHAQDVSIPVAYEIVHKPILYCDLKTKKEKRKSEVTKNEHMRNMLVVCRQNQLVYKYVLTDSWFASNENMRFIKKELSKEFIMAIKDNRTVALSLEDKLHGRFVRVDSLMWEKNDPRLVYVKGLDFPVLLIREVFKNKDNSEGILYLVCSDTDLSYDQITAIYKKRWKVEVFHKSIKSNASLSKSPTKTVRTQSNHFFAAIYAFFKLESLNTKHQLSHFALKSKLYLKALQASFSALQELRA